MRWTNQSLPQTLQIGVILLYIDAFFAMLNGSAFSGFGFLFAIGSVIGAIGIANEKRLGYYLAVAVSSIFLIFIIRYLFAGGELSDLFRIEILLGLIFPIAQLAALLHAQSREHQRVYFS